ncbi:hypothetical protein ABIC83_002775 [Roseateles asaccharophilus]|uniref:hypothetical protein n=1 Tax=Roseateles asaccharophilus TaxID=582607 RepID=UPI003837723A
MTEQLLDGTVMELMMPVQSRRQGDDLVVHNVDLKRAARNFLNKTRAPDWVPPRDLNQAMEFMATFFGYANLMAANKQAADAPEIELMSTLVYQKLEPSPEAPSLEPMVVVYVGDSRFNDDEPRHALERARKVGPGVRELHLDMANFESISTLRQFRKLGPPMPQVVVCSNIELGAHSRSTSELMSVMVNHPDIEFRLVMRTLAEAHDLFATWVYQDHSAAISGFTADVKDAAGEGRVHYQTKAYDPADTRHTRSLVAYPSAFHDLLLKARARSAARVSARPPTHFALGAEDLAARKATFAAASPDSAKAAVKNATHSIFFGPGRFVTKEAAHIPEQQIDATSSTLPDSLDRVLKEYLDGRGVSRQIPVLVAKPNLDAKSIMRNLIDGGTFDKAFIIDSRENKREQLWYAMRNSPDIILFDHADQAVPEALMSAIADALNTGHRIALRVSDPLWTGPAGLDLGARCAVEAPSPVAPARRKRRP